MSEKKVLPKKIILIKKKERTKSSRRRPGPPPLLPLDYLPPIWEKGNGRPERNQYLLSFNTGGGGEKILNLHPGQKKGLRSLIQKLQ